MSYGSSEAVYGVIPSSGFGGDAHVLPIGIVAFHVENKPVEQNRPVTHGVALQSTKPKIKTQTYIAISLGKIVTCACMFKLYFKLVTSMFRSYNLKTNWWTILRAI